LTGLLADAEQAANQTDGHDQGQALRALTPVYNAASSLLRKLGDCGLALVAANRAVQPPGRWMTRSCWRRRP